MLGPETFTQKGRDRKKSALLKVFDWLLFGRLRKDKKSKEDDQLKKESEMSPYELLEQFQKLGEKKAEKGSQEAEVKDIEVKDKNKTHKFRDRLQHAVAETREVVANASGTDKFTQKDAHLVAEDLINKNDLAFKKAFSKSLPEYLVQKSPELSPVDVAKEVKKAQIKSMVTAIAEGKVNFSIRGEVRDESGKSESAKKISIHLDRGDADQRIEELRQSRKNEIDEANIDAGEKERLKGRVDEEIGILKDVKSLREKFSENRRGEIDGLVERTAALLEEEKGDLEYTNLESVLDSDTLESTEKGVVHTNIVNILREDGSEQVKAALNKPVNGQKEPDSAEEVVSKAKSKYRPVHTQLLEHMVVGFAEKHSKARKFFEDEDGEHLSIKLMDSTDNEADANEYDRELTKRENKLKSIVSYSLNEVYGTKDAERIKDEDKIVHVPGGVAIVVTDAERFVEMTGLGGTDAETKRKFAESIRDKRTAGAFLKGEIAKKINESYGGGIIIAYADPNAIGEEDKYNRIQNIWEKENEGENVRSLLIHEIDHLLQKRQLEGLTGKTEEILGKTGLSVEELLEDISKGRENSQYYKKFSSEIEADPLLSALVKGIVSKDEALKAYEESSVGKVEREALFEYSARLSQGQFEFEEPSLDLMYIKKPDGKIPNEHIGLYKLLLTANLVLNKVKGKDIHEQQKVRRELVAMIQTGYHRGSEGILKNIHEFFSEDYLKVETNSEGGTFVSEIDAIIDPIKNGKATVGEINKMYSSTRVEVLLPDGNANIDFSVFPFNPREKADYTGDPRANANNAIDFVDAWSTTMFGAPFRWARSQQLERQAQALNDSDPEMARFLRLRKPENRAGEEMSPDSSLVMKIAENLPVIGAFMIPGKIEWAKAGILKPSGLPYGPKGHPLYGRTMKRIPVVGPLLERHFPVLLDKGPFKQVKGYEPDPRKLVSADKNIDCMLQGLQVGLDAMGLDRQEMLAVIEALPLFRTVQSSPAMEPQPVFSLSGLEEDSKQIWFDRRPGNDPVTGEDKNWKIDFEKEVIYGELGEDAKIDEAINKAEAKLNAIPNRERWGKAAADQINKIKKLKELRASTNPSGKEGEVDKMTKIFRLMEAQKNVDRGRRFTMRHLVEFSRKAHEGHLWRNARETNYFKVPIPKVDNPQSDSDYEYVHLSDVNMFIKRYTRAYVKEMFVSHQNPDTRKNLAIKDYNARDAEYKMPLYDSQIKKITEELTEHGLSDDEKNEKKRELAQILAARQQLDLQYNAGAREYKFLTEGKGFEEGTFFDIAWGEAESMLDNHQTGMSFYADYQIRSIQTAMIERKTFLAATFYTRLDRVLDNLGHTAVIAGLALAFATGAPIAITIALGGVAALLADAAFVTKAQQVWQARRLKALEAQEKMDNMISLYEQAASGKMLSPDQLEMLGRQKERLTFMVESIMKVDPREVVKFPGGKAFFAISATGLALFDEYGSNILAGKI